MKVLIENLQPLYYLFKINMSTFSMQEKLFGLGHLQAVGSVKGQEYGRLEVAVFIFEMIEMRGKHVDEVFHDEWNVHDGLVLGFCIHNWKDVIEGGVYF